MPGNKELTKPKHIFAKGESGNPSGRPAVPDAVKKMLKAAVPEAVKLLIDTMADIKVKPETRILCANTIIDRVYGKATQIIDSQSLKNFSIQIEVVNSLNKADIIPMIQHNLQDSIEDTADITERL
jgi:hypothetical protein